MDKNCLELDQTLLSSEEIGVGSNISKHVENIEDNQEQCMSFIDSTDHTNQLNEGFSLMLLENHNTVFSSIEDESSTRSNGINTFGNCPWNLNSSILVNSVAERQAQKRKIRNGQLPIPKLVNRNPSILSVNKPLNISFDKTNSQESELPDTVQISTSTSKELQSDELVNVCESNNYSPMVDKMVISHQNLTIEPSSLLSLPDTLDVKLLQGNLHINGEHFDETNYTSKITLPSESKIFNIASIERLDGLVLNLNYSNCLPQTLTVIQEKRITYFENRPRTENGEKFFKWCKSASIPVLSDHLNNTYSYHEIDRKLEWISGLRPVGWQSVALQMDVKQCNITAYAYRSSNVILLKSFPLCLEDSRDMENLNLSLVSANEVVMWFNLKGKRGTELMKCFLKNDLTGLTKVNDLIRADSCIKSLHQVNAKSTIIVGIDEKSRIFIWDHSSGILIKCIQMQINNLSSSCIRLIEDRGYIFLLLSEKLGCLNLMALNANSEKWMNLKIYSADIEGRFTDCVVNNGLLFASYEQGITVWDLHLGNELTSIVAQNTKQIYILSNKTFFVTASSEIYSVDNSQILKM